MNIEISVLFCLLSNITHLAVKKLSNILSKELRAEIKVNKNNRFNIFWVIKAYGLSNKNTECLKSSELFNVFLVAYFK